MNQAQQDAPVAPQVAPQLSQDEIDAQSHRLLAQQDKVYQGIIQYAKIIEELNVVYPDLVKFVPYPLGLIQPQQVQAQAQAIAQAAQSMKDAQAQFEAAQLAQAAQAVKDAEVVDAEIKPEDSENNN